jgi:hypothetical protein
VNCSPPQVEAQIAKIHTPVLLDSGSARSLISLSQFRQLNPGGPEMALQPTTIGCSSASGQNLEIVGESKLVLKIHGYSWSCTFLVSKRLKSTPILGADFIGRNNLVLDLGKSRCFFRFTPNVYIPFLKKLENLGCYHSVSLSNRTPCIRSGKLNFQQKNKLEGLIHKYPDVLTSRLGLTKLLEYDIQLLDKTPVRLAPYRLAPPKMRYLREHVKQLLQDGVIEPPGNCVRN